MTSGSCGQRTFKEIRQRISSILVSDMRIPVDSLDDNLVDNELLDSASFMELFVLIEEAFDLKIEGADLAIDNFKNILSMTEFVEKKLNNNC